MLTSTFAIDMEGGSWTLETSSLYFEIRPSTIKNNINAVVCTIEA